ncbi:spermidine resistance protein, partial [Kickxella alabastrina]
TDTAVNNSAEGSPLFCAISRSSSRSTVHSMLASSDYATTAAAAAASGRGSRASLAVEDTTVEILMTGLDPERMRVMYLGGVSSEEGAIGGKAVEHASGISAIYPESASDSYLFTPCGFSLNGVQGDGYYTIHVTPEPHCSYASFETNISNDSGIDLHKPEGIKSLVEKVTKAFGPRYVTVTVFKARGGDELSGGYAPGPAAGAAAGKDRKALRYAAADADVAPPAFEAVDGYKSVDRVLYEFDHYWLRYGYYVMAD